MVGKALRETVPAAFLHFRQTAWILKYSTVHIASFALRIFSSGLILNGLLDCSENAKNRVILLKCQGNSLTSSRETNVFLGNLGRIFLSNSVADPDPLVRCSDSDPYTIKQK
jgi:hypothetical protein